MLHAQRLTFHSRSKALPLFLDAVQGHIGDAMALIRRLQTSCLADSFITEQDVTEPLKDYSKTCR